MSRGIRFAKSLKICVHAFPLSLFLSLQRLRIEGRIRLKATSRAPIALSRGRGNLREIGTRSLCGLWRGPSPPFTKKKESGLIIRYIYDRHVDAWESEKGKRRKEEEEVEVEEEGTRSGAIRSSVSTADSRRSKLIPGGASVASANA